MNNAFLIVGTGTNRAIFDDTEANYPAPSTIVPSLEMIKNTERSLGGKMHVDIVATKKRLRIVFDMLSDTHLRKILDRFEVGKDKDYISPVGHKVWYFDLPDGETKDFFVDEATFDPLVIEDGIKWRNVTINLLEI